jgi:glycosyltransferase involved in cell wall biosynthesis
MRGGQHQVLLLLKGLKEAGHESILLAHPKGALASAARARGLAVYPATFWQLWCRSKAVTIVHAHDARAHTLASVAACQRFVVSRRVAFPVRSSYASRWKYRQAVAFLAVSQFVASRLEAAGIPKEKVEVVYDGTEIDVAASQWTPQAPAVALASRDPQKGRDLVEQAAALADLPIIFSDNLPEDLKRASMLVYITQSEGLGSAALLAMSMGVPVIASAVDGLREVFEDGVSGLFVANDALAIARAMRTVVSDPILAQRLRQNGPKRVAERFSRDHLIRGTLQVYERALAH